MTSCVVCGISVYQVKRCKLSLGFHQFPAEPTLRQVWEDFCGGGDDEQDDSTKSKRAICSDHFEEEWFRGGGKRVLEPGRRHVLKDGAVPTIRVAISWQIVDRRLKKMQERSEKMEKIKSEIQLAPIIEPASKAEEVCRICESENNLHDLTLKENADHAWKFSSLTSIEIDANAPWLCEGCLGRLNDAHEFVQACVVAENRRNSLPFVEMLELKQEEEVQECWEEPMVEFTADHAEQINEEKEEDEGDGSEDNLDSDPEPERPKVHSCEACPATFEKKSEFFAHVRIHGKARFPCKQCDRSFGRRYHLAEHMISHKSERSYLCNLCPTRFKNQTSLNRHVKDVHLNLKPYGCKECGKQFAQNIHLKLHAEVHMKEATIPCELCQKMFKSSFRLRVHLRTAHTDKQKTDKQPKAGIFACDVCSKEFSTKQTLAYHKGCHAEPNLLCTICGKKYRTNGLLAAHMTTHNPKSFSCELCPSKFNSKKSLLYHQQAHSGLKPYQCELCDRSFRARTHLKTHHISVHTGEKPHECHICHKRCALKGNLRLHMKVHLGERKEGEGEENPEVSAWSNDSI